MSKKTVIYYFHGHDVGITRRFISLPRCREVGSIQRLYIISMAVMSGLPEGLLVCHGVVRLVPSNRLYIISTAVMSGLPEGLLVCHGVVRLVPSNRLYIISTIVMSGLPEGY